MRTRKKLLSLLTALLLTITLLPVSAKAAGMYMMACGEGDLFADPQHVKGNYSWDQDSRTLTLSGVEIDALTDGGSGLILSCDATIHLTAGTVNVIRSEYDALLCAESPNGERYDLRIEGGGTLELINRQGGSLCAQNLSVAGGSVSIRSNDDPAVRCGALNIAGGSLDVRVNQENSISEITVTAVQADTVTVSGGRLSSHISVEKSAPIGVKANSYLQTGGEADLDVLNVKNDCAVTGGSIKLNVPASSTTNGCLTAAGALTLKNCTAEMLGGPVDAGNLSIDNATVRFSNTIVSKNPVSLKNVTGAKTLNDSQGIPKFVTGEKQSDGSMLIRPSGGTAVTYSVTYNLNGGQGSVPASGKYEPGRSVQIPTAPTREGFTFTGWSDGTSTYQPGQSFTMPAANVTLTAQWAPKAPTPLTLITDSAAAAPKTYDGTTAAAVTGLTFQNEAGAAVNLTAGRDYTLTATFDTANAGSGKTVTGTVQLLGSQYTLDTGSFTLTGEIRKASVVISAVNKTAKVGDPEPSYTWTVSGLARGESLKTPPTASAQAVDMNKAGLYTIELSGAAVPDTGNYENTISYRPGILTVQEKNAQNDPDRDDNDRDGGASSSNAITLPASSNSAGGSISISTASGKKGEKITITVTPEEGYQLESLSVRNAANRAIPVTAQGGGKYTFIMPATKVSVSAAFARLTPAQQSAGAFRDVPSDFWAGNAIRWASEQGYMNGTGTASFQPDGTVTRQQLWMILARHSGKAPADMAAAAAWASGNGVSDGSNPGGKLSRQQLVTILYRYAQSTGGKTGGGVRLDAYPDHGGVADYAKDAMAWAIGNGILSGTAQGTLAASGAASRAQLAVILMRFCEKSF